MQPLERSSNSMMATDIPTSLPPPSTTEDSRSRSSTASCRNLSTLTFSIAKIMEPDKRLSSESSSVATTILRQPVPAMPVTYSAHLESAFKKYVPTLRQQSLLQHYPLLYYHPNPLLRAFPGGPVSTANTTPPAVSHSVSPPISPSHATTRLDSTTNGKKSPVAPLPLSAPSSTSSSQSSPQGQLSSSREINSNKQKTFACPECGKIFNAHYNLTRHMPVHTGARPFVKML